MNDHDKNLVMVARIKAATKIVLTVAESCPVYKAAEGFLIRQLDDGLVKSNSTEPKADVPKIVR